MSDPCRRRIGKACDFGDGLGGRQPDIRRQRFKSDLPARRFMCNATATPLSRFAIPGYSFWLEPMIRKMHSLRIW